MEQTHIDRARRGGRGRRNRGWVTRALVGSMLLLLPGIAGVNTVSGVELPPQAAQEAVEHTHGPDPVDLDRRGRPQAAQPYDVDAHASWSKGGWDGASFTQDQPDLTTLPTVHAVYVYPSNGKNRFLDFAAMFQADARDTTRLMASHAAGVRFDERAGANGTAYVDITVLKSRHNANVLGSNRQFSLVRDELVSRGFTNPNKKYVVWLDAASRYCGQAELYQDVQRSSNNANEQRTTAIVYRPYATTDPLSGGFCRGRTLLHELGHNMGALQAVAPSSFDDAHCNDSAEDVMCYTSQTSNDTGSPAFDWNTDDYWDPVGGKLGWWTVNLSRFICPPASSGTSSPTCSSANRPSY